MVVKWSNHCFVLVLFPISLYIPKNHYLILHLKDEDKVHFHIWHPVCKTMQFQSHALFWDCTKKPNSVNCLNNSETKKGLRLLIVVDKSTNKIQVRQMEKKSVSASVITSVDLFFSICQKMISFSYYARHLDKKKALKEPFILNFHILNLANLIGL